MPPPGTLVQVVALYIPLTLVGKPTSDREFCAHDGTLMVISVNTRPGPPLIYYRANEPEDSCVELVLISNQGQLLTTGSRDFKVIKTWFRNL